MKQIICFFRGHVYKKYVMLTIPVMVCDRCGQLIASEDDKKDLEKVVRGFNKTNELENQS